MGVSVGRGFADKGISITDLHLHEERSDTQVVRQFLDKGAGKVASANIIQLAAENGSKGSS